MPAADNWVDVWESACPGPNASLKSNPCTPLYQQYRDATGGRVEGFSQQPTTQLSAAYPNWVDQAWTLDGTPIIQQPSSLWYPGERGVCNATEPLVTACVEAHILNMTRGAARFVLAYGVSDYVNVASAVQERLASAGVVVLGAQDLAALAWQSGPRATP
eukprot:m.261171 g.261171  ORF g.261171 m.261171 type:complete len:160 (-) comp26660_c1_seq2:1831-2310(-)